MIKTETNSTPDLDAEFRAFVSRARTDYAMPLKVITPEREPVKPKVIERAYCPRSKHAGGWQKSPRRRK